MHYLCYSTYYLIKTLGNYELNAQANFQETKVRFQNSSDAQFSIEMSTIEHKIQPSPTNCTTMTSGQRGYHRPLVGGIGKTI